MKKLLIVNNGTDIINLFHLLIQMLIVVIGTILMTSIIKTSIGTLPIESADQNFISFFLIVGTMGISIVIWITGHCNSISYAVFGVLSSLVIAITFLGIKYIAVNDLARLEIPVAIIGTIFLMGMFPLNIIASYTAANFFEIGVWTEYSEYNYKTLSKIKP